MAEQTNEIILVNAKWSNDVDAYVATVEGKRLIITVDGRKSTTTKPAENLVTVAKPAARRGKPAKKAIAPIEEAPAAAAKPVKAKNTKAKRVRSPSLSPVQEAEVLGLIATGKNFTEVAAQIPGVTIGIYRRLQRVSAAKPAKKAKKAAAKKPGKRAKVAPAA